MRLHVFIWKLVDSTKKILARTHSHKFSSDFHKHAMVHVHATHSHPNKGNLKKKLKGYCLIASRNLSAWLLWSLWIPTWVSSHQFLFLCPSSPVFFPCYCVRRLYFTATKEQGTGTCPWFWEKHGHAQIPYHSECFLWIFCGWSHHTVMRGSGWRMSGMVNVQSSLSSTCVWDTLGVFLDVQNSIVGLFLKSEETHQGLAMDQNVFSE